MSTFQLDLNKQQSLKTTKDLSRAKQQEVINFFTKNPEFEIQEIAKKFNISKTSVLVLALRIYLKENDSLEENQNQE